MSLARRTETDASPNRTASDPLLPSQAIDLDNPPPNDSQHNRNDVGTIVTSEEEPNDALQPPFSDQTHWSVASIVGGLVVAVALAVGHHIFLAYLHDRDIDEYPQVWIKGANNGFSNVFSILVGLSCAAALTQIKWQASSSEPLRTHILDSLFALPAPCALLKTLMHPRRCLLFPILSSVLIHALVLVSILAPSALTVAPSAQISREIEVQISSLGSQSRFVKLDTPTVYSDDRWPLAYLSLTTIGEERINSVLLNLPEFTWTIPQYCGLKCAFYLQYNAPGLECHDVMPEPHPDPTSNVYQANSNLYLQNLAIPPSQQMDFDAPYNLSINYTSIRTRDTITRGGTYCRFYQATYNASFELNSNSNTQRASTSIISRGDYLSRENTATIPHSHDKMLEQRASWAICYAFALAFWGGPISISRTYEIPQTNPVLASIFNITASASSFELTTSNLSHTLMDLFSNLTLGLMSARGSQDPVLVKATVWDGSSAWLYTNRILLAVYLPAVILAIVVTLYGLHIIHANEIAMSDGFSTILLAIQNTKLYELCRKLRDFKDLGALEFQYRMKETFEVVKSYN